MNETPSKTRLNPFVDLLLEVISDNLDIPEGSRVIEGLSQSQLRVNAVMSLNNQSGASLQEYVRNVAHLSFGVHIRLMESCIEAARTTTEVADIRKGVLGGQ